MSRQDKSAAGWDHFEKVEKHNSQKGELGNQLSVIIGLDLDLDLFPRTQI